MIKLIIGNYNYSSWSLRAWLHLRASNIAFEVERVALFGEGWREQIAGYSPAGRVPILIDGDVTVWDSLAIVEYVIDTRPDSVAWPAERRARAHARSIGAEMHSGFLAIRNELPQNIRMRKALSGEHLSGECRSLLQRVDDIWSGCRAEYRRRGPWLFGELTVADIFYAPVVRHEAQCEEFVAAVQEFDPVREWVDAAAAESEALDYIDDLRPIEQTPLTPG